MRVARRRTPWRAARRGWAGRAARSASPQRLKLVLGGAGNRRGLGGYGLWALGQSSKQVMVEVGRRVEGGLGSGADQHGNLYHYLLTGQTDKWKNRHRDKQTARERSRTQGSLFYFTTGNVTDTIKMGGGGGERRAPVLSSQRRRPEWQSGGRERVGSKAPSPLRPR